MTASTALLTVDGDHVWAKFTYNTDAITALKALGGCRWNPTRKEWTCPLNKAHDVVQIFDRLGYTVEWATTPPSTPQPATTDPFRALFSTLPPNLRQPVYRALAKALHPDAGGDLDLMRRVNVAYGEATARK